MSSAGGPSGCRESSSSCGASRPEKRRRGTPTAGTGQAPPACGPPGRGAHARRCTTLSPRSCASVPGVVGATSSRWARGAPRRCTSTCRRASSKQLHVQETLACACGQGVVTAPSPREGGGQGRVRPGLPRPRGGLQVRRRHAPAPAGAAAGARRRAHEPQHADGPLPPVRRGAARRFRVRLLQRIASCRGGVGRRDAPARAGREEDAPGLPLDIPHPERKRRVAHRLPLQHGPGEQDAQGGAGRHHGRARGGRVHRLQRGDAARRPRPRRLLGACAPPLLRRAGHRRPRPARRMDFILVALPGGGPGARGRGGAHGRPPRAAPAAQRARPGSSCARS